MSTFIHEWNSFGNKSSDQDLFRFPRSRFSESLLSGSEIETKVFISHPWNSSTFTVFAKEDLFAINGLHLAMMRLLWSNRLRPLDKLPEPGSFVLARYLVNRRNFLFRGIVLRRAFLDNDDEVTVLFYDLGDSIKVSYSQCYHTPQSILEKPIYGLLISAPGVPAEVDETLDEVTITLLADNYDASVFSCEGIDSIETISVVSPLKVSSLRVFACQSHNNADPTDSETIEWHDFICRAVTSAGKRFPMTYHWNPFSSQGMQVISKACDGDPDKVEQMIDAQLLTWSSKFFQRQVDTIKEHQIEILSTVAATSGTQFTREMWSDSIRSFFCYDQVNVPSSPIPPGEQISVRIRHFSNLQHWTGMITSEPFSLYRKTLGRELNEYCQLEHAKRSQQQQDKTYFYQPFRGQTCFVYLSTLKGMNEIFEILQNPADDDSEAYSWYRGLCLRRLKSEKEDFATCAFYEFYLIDLGRYVVVSGENVLPPILKFLTVPKLAVTGRIAEPVTRSKKAQLQDWIQTTAATTTELDLLVIDANFNGSALFDIVMTEKSTEVYKSYLEDQNEDPSYLNRIAAEDRYNDEEDY